MRELAKVFDKSFDKLRGVIILPEAGTVIELTGDNGISFGWKETVLAGLLNPDPYELWEIEIVILVDFTYSRRGLAINTLRARSYTWGIRVRSYWFEVSRWYFGVFDK